MGESKLQNFLKRYRGQLGLSQQQLADRVGVSRQAIFSIEAGRQVPSTSLALQLSQTLGCSVEHLFCLGTSAGIEARLADSRNPGSHAVRVALGNIEGRWAAHPLPADGAMAADAIVFSESEKGMALVRPLFEAEQLSRNVLVAGCAPLLGALSQRVGRRFFDASIRCLSASSGRALDLLKKGLVHVAGVHLTNREQGVGNEDAVRRLFPGEPMVMVNLTRWRQGLVVPPGNPKKLRVASDLLRPQICFVGRESGAGANQLISRLLASEGLESSKLSGPIAMGHEEVARRVQFGVADAGVAIESVALSLGLGFVPLAEERFDLVLPASLAVHPPVTRLIEAMDDPGFRAEVAQMPGYDSSLCGHTTTLEAA